MGKLTGRTIRAIVGTGRGSDYYGRCERCGKPASEIFKLITGPEYVRDNGETYSTTHAVSHGHKECIIRDYGDPAVPEVKS